MVALASGCRGTDDEGKYAAEAQRVFTHTYSCPPASVAATPRPDLRAYDLQVGPTSPPKEVAADPARLAQWKKNQAEIADGYQNERVIWTRGCGHAVYYLCGPATGSNGQQLTACSEAAYPPR